MFCSEINKPLLYTGLHPALSQPIYGGFFFVNRLSKVKWVIIEQQTAAGFSFAVIYNLFQSIAYIDVQTRSSTIIIIV